MKRAGAGLREQVLCVIGFGTLLSTLLLYSVPVVTFAAFSETLGFIVPYAPVMLTATAVVALVFLIVMLTAKRLDRHLGKHIILFACPLFAVGVLGFVFMSLSGSSNRVLTVIVSLIVALGSVLLCLVWGRIFSRFALRQALTTIALSCALSAVAYWLLYNLPLIHTGVVFIILAIPAAALPWFFDSSPRKQEPGVEISRPGVALRSLMTIAGMPLSGLIACAFCMAVMRAQLSNSFDLYVVAVLVVVILLLVFALLVRRTVNLVALHMAFLPLFAILMLAVAGFAEQLQIGDQLTMFFVYLLYMAAAIIALVTLTAIANAGEFSSDLVFTLALFLFAAASALGQGVAELVSRDSVILVTILVTMLYAIASVLVFYLRWFRERPLKELGNPKEHPEGNLEKKSKGNPKESRHIDTGSASASDQKLPENPSERLAREYQLTTRELEILEMLAAGHRGPFISEVLFISPNTVRTHIHNIYRKLDVSSREDILRLTHPPA